jgi:hypothetical protein
MTRTESIVTICEKFESVCSEFDADRTKRYGHIHLCDACYDQLSATMNGLNINQKEIEKCFNEYHTSDHWRKNDD